VLEVRVSKSRPDQGVIKVKRLTLNQRNEPVQVSVGSPPRSPSAGVNSLRSQIRGGAGGTDE
jgi:hypothetical protein